MGALFGKPREEGAPRPAPQSTITSHDRCVLQLKKERDKLKKAQRVFEAKGERDRDAAVHFLREEGACKEKGDAYRAKLNRDKALYCLKRRKAQERHIERTFALLENIETMMREVDARQFDTEVAEALRAATGELKAINDHLSLDEVAEIMESAQEQVRITEEVSELLSQNLTFSDEALLEDELDALVKQNHIPVKLKKGQETTVAVAVADITVPHHPIPAVGQPSVESAEEAPERQAIAM